MNPESFQSSATAHETPVKRSVLRCERNEPHVERSLLRCSSPCAQPNDQKQPSKLGSTRAASWRRLLRLRCASIAGGLFAVTAWCAATLMATPALAQDPESNAPAPAASEYRSIDALRRGAPLAEEPPAAPMARVQNEDLRRKRGWPEQPPTIPHSIDGYQVSKEANRCMICHSRGGAEQFQAPMVSVTHFMDRDGQVLAQISARRYFCNQCHVVQTDAPLLVENGFQDIDTVITASRER